MISFDYFGTSSSRKSVRYLLLAKRAKELKFENEKYCKIQTQTKIRKMLLGVFAI